MSNVPKEPRERKTRAKNAKVKSGCLTCKIRRVKCDETWPQCLRCLKFGPGFCDGYGTTKVTRDSRRAIALGQSTTFPKLAPKQDPVIQAFKNQHEFNCFRLYCEEVAPQLSLSNQSIWHKLLLQAGQNQPFIRHAIVAMGALNRFLQPSTTNVLTGDGKRPSMVLGGNAPVTSNEYSFGLEHYDKFLRGAKGDLSLMSKEEARRTAMLACLLVVCIENMQYEYTSALTHAQNGFRLMEELRNDAAHRETYDGLSSPVPNIIEDEIIQQFNRMEIQVMAVHDGRPTSTHVKLKEEGTAGIRNMPASFTTVDQARLYLVLVLRRTFHFMAYALSDPSHLQFEMKENVSNLTNYSSANGEFRLRAAPEELHVEQEMYAAENRRWSLAFEPLLRVALHDLERIDSIRVLLLKIHSSMMTVRLAGHLSESELVYDNYMREFREVVDYTEIILNHQHVDKFFGDGAFTFDMGLIYPVSIPAMHCRDRTLRRKAMTLLRMRPWREAQWHSEVAADVAKFLMEIEEEDVDTYYSPEQARARLSGVIADLANGGLHVHAIQGVGEDAKHRERMMYYYLDSGTWAWARAKGELPE